MKIDSYRGIPGRFLRVMVAIAMMVLVTAPSVPAAASVPLTDVPLHAAHVGADSQAFANDSDDGGSPTRSSGTSYSTSSTTRHPWGPSPSRSGTWVP